MSEDFDIVREAMKPQSMSTQSFDEGQVALRRIESQLASLTEENERNAPVVEAAKKLVEVRQPDGNKPYLDAVFGLVRAVQALSPIDPPLAPKETE